MDFCTLSYSQTFRAAKTSGSITGVNCTQHLHVVSSSIAKLPDDAFVSVVTADACFMVNLVCLFMKPHLLVLLQDNCLHLLRCAFLRKLSECVRNITAFCQLLSAVLADTDISVKPKYRLIYWSISSLNYYLRLEI